MEKYQDSILVFHSFSEKADQKFSREICFRSQVESYFNKQSELKRYAILSAEWIFYTIRGETE